MKRILYLISSIIILAYGCGNKVPEEVIIKEKNKITYEDYESLIGTWTSGCVIKKEVFSTERLTFLPGMLATIQIDYFSDQVCELSTGKQIISRIAVKFGKKIVTDHGRFANEIDLRYLESMVNGINQNIDKYTVYNIIAMHGENLHFGEGGLNDEYLRPYELNMKNPLSRY